MNWMKRAERMSGGGREEKLNTIKWKKPANSIDLDQFPLIFLLLPFMDLYFICAVAFISNQSNEQVQSAKKTTTTHKIFILFSPLSIRCFPLQYLPNTPDIHRHTQTRIYVEWIERIWVQVSALFVCLFIWFIRSFAYPIAPSPKIWSLDLNASKYYGLCGSYNVIKIEEDEQKNENFPVQYIFCRCCWCF